MNNSRLYYLCSSILITIITSLFSFSLLVASNNDMIAIFTKGKGDVKIKQSSNKKTISKPSKGQDLYDNDKVTTGKDGFAKYTYLDDGTEIKVHNNSEIYVRGAIKDRSIIKQISVSEGVLKFEVEKQGGDEFTVITPTSVASVKGTDFWLDCNGKNGDQFFGVSGRVSIQNSISGRITQLTKNTAASSMPDGSVDLRPITQSELNTLNNIEISSGEVQEDDQNSNPDLNEDGKIELEFEDGSGNTKTVIIRYN